MDVARAESRLTSQVGSRWDLRGKNNSGKYAGKAVTESKNERHELLQDISAEDRAGNSEESVIDSRIAGACVRYNEEGTLVARAGHTTTYPSVASGASAHSIGSEKKFNINISTTIQLLAEQLKDSDENLEFGCSESEIDSYPSPNENNYVGSLQKPIKFYELSRILWSKDLSFGATLVVRILLKTVNRNVVLRALKTFGKRHKLKFEYLSNPTTNLETNTFSKRESDHGFNVKEIIELSKVDEKTERQQPKLQTIEETSL